MHESILSVIEFHKFNISSVSKWVCAGSLYIDEQMSLKLMDAESTEVPARRRTGIKRNQTNNVGNPRFCTPHRINQIFHLFPTKVIDPVLSE